MSDSVCRVDSEKEETLLVARAKQGDDRAFAELEANYGKIIRLYIKKYMPPSFIVDREDLFQEGLVGLLKAVRTYDGCSSAFATYASSCIKHSIISALRSYSHSDGKLVPLDEESEALISESSPESDFIDRESSSILYDRIFSELSLYEKSVFELYLCDLSYAEIAGKLGKTEKGIANAICRIRRKLKKLLSKTE